MSQFGAKNSPWGRTPGAAQQLNPQLFTGMGGMSLAAAAQQFAVPNAAMQLQGLSAMGGLGAAVNAAAFSQPPVSLAVSSPMAAVSGRQVQAGIQQQLQQQTQKNQRAFVGTITKMQDNYGFVDDDVFFQVNVVRGAMPRIGDRVMVEANYNPSMPFKWNAFRIQLLPNQDPQPPQQSAPPRIRETDRWGPPTNQSAPAPAPQYRPRSRSPMINRRRERTPPRRSSPHRRPSPRRRSPSPRRHGSVMSNSSSLKRERSPLRSTDREKRDTASRSPPRRRQRIIPRYNVQVPKTYLNIREAGIADVRRRYPNLYIPSDFFYSTSAWQSTFPLTRPLSLDNQCSYHIMHRDIDCLTENTAVFDPPDADHRYCAKVMLLSLPTLAEFYRKTLGVLDEGILSEDAEIVTPSRVISFLVGLRGKSEVLAIGGPWSPSLDGQEPETDPRVLIRTAIRTTKALTGIDLSKCTQWYKFMELRYRRIDKEKGAAAIVESAARVDTVVIYIPDIWSVMPTKIEFEQLQTLLKSQLETKVAELDKKPEEIQQIPPIPPPTTEAEEPKETNEKAAAATDDSAAQQDDIEEVPVEEMVAEEVEDEEKPTHWSKLDLSTMKVADLRKELGARSLEKKGVKNVLINRLQEAIKTEEEEEKNKPTEEKEEKPEIEEIPQEKEEEKKPEEVPEEKMEVEPIPEPEKKVVEEKPEIDEKEKQRIKEKEERERKEKKTSLERHYAMPSAAQPGILVFPHKTAKGGKFDCKVMSLNALLDYRQEDNKEHSFEVASFAEAFNEMLTRDCAFTIYKALLSAPDKDAEKKIEKEVEAAKAEEVKEAETKKEEADKPSDVMDTSTTETTAESAKVEADQKKEGEEEKKEEKKEEKEKEEKKDEKDDKKSSPKADKKPQSSRSSDKEDNKKTVIVIKDPALLFAFGLFDQSHCGYLFDRDAEEIMFSMGLELSRAQVQRLLKRLVIRDTFNYRKLTDTLMIKDTKEIKSEPTLLSLPDEESILRGNKDLTFWTKAKSTGTISNKAQTQGPPDVTDSSVVVYEGAIVDVGQTLIQTKRLEKEQQAMEQRNQALEKELKSTKDKRDALHKKYRRLDDDYEKYKKRLYDAERCLKTSQDDTVQLKTSMQECKKLGERITYLVDKVMPSKEKEKTPKKKEEKKSEEIVVKSEVKAEESEVIVLDGNGENEPTEMQTDDLTVKDEIVENDKPEAEMDEKQEDNN